MSRTTARLALAFALFGLGASTIAAYTHYRLLTDASYLSFCDVSATVSCTEAYSSRFGSVGGVPVAVFGALWFAIATLLAWTGLAARPAVRENIPGYLFAGSTLALSAILYLGYASFVVLKVVCVLCLMTYAAVIGLFLVSGAAVSTPMLSLPRRALTDLKVLISSPLALVLAVLVVGGAASAVAFFPREGALNATADAAGAPEAAPAARGTTAAAAAENPAATATPAAATPATAGPQSAAQQPSFDPKFLKFYTSQPRVLLVVPSEGAKVLVVKFNDYQCPACGQSHRDYKAVFAKYAASHPGEVKLVMKDFPLENECNDNVKTSLHPGACEAAAAVRLAPEGRKAPLEDWLFSNQQGMTPETVRKAAREIGQIADFDSRYQLTLDGVKADIAYGRQLAVRSTPTFFINGVKLEGALPAQFFDQAIAYELQRVAGK
jgi:uncharacterized membrane protein/protein-disulfide isomerase